MPLPRLTLEPGSTWHVFVPSQDYQDLATMLQDIRDGLIEYPDAELRVVDDPPNRRIGFSLSTVLDDAEHWWDFFIGVQDFNRCLDTTPNTPAVWIAMRSYQGRLAMVQALRTSSHTPWPDKLTTTVRVPV